MARSEDITLAGAPFTVRELKIRELREVTLPKIMPILGLFKDVATVEDALERIPEIEKQLAGAVPGLTAELLDEAVPSELEAFVEAFINVNFLGLKKLLGQALSAKPGAMFKS